MSNKITIDGKVYQGGNNIIIKDDKVYIDGKEIDTGDQKQISIHVKGNVETIDADSCPEIYIEGHVTNGIKTMSGDVTCQDVFGDVGTMSGDVTTSKIGGSVSTMSGDITQKG